MNSPNAASRLVYSTDSGKICPDCRQPLAGCICRKAPTRAVPSGDVRVSRQTKGRGGKSVTLVTGLLLDDAALAALTKQLRTACGSGGTVKAGVIEVQGDHTGKLVELLTQLGHAPKRAGG